MSEYSDVFWQMGTRCPFSVYGHCGFKFPHHTSVWKVWEPTLVQYSAVSSGEICTFSRGKWKQSSSVKTLHIHHSVQWSSKGNKKKNTFFTERGLKNNPKCYSVPESYTLDILMPKMYLLVASFPNMFCDWLFSHVKDTLRQMHLSLHLTVQGYVHFNPSIFFSTLPPHAESEVCKLETLLQSEVSVVTTGEAVGADAAKTPPALRRRKRTCSRRQGEKEREREGGGMGLGDRGDRGVGEDRDRREASESDRIQMLKCFGFGLQSFLPTLKVTDKSKRLNPSSVQYSPLVVLFEVASVNWNVCVGLLNVEDVKKQSEE